MSTEGGSDMGAKENMAVHAAWTDAKDRHDLTHHGDFLHDDIELHLPGSGLLTGLDAYLTMMQANHAGLDDFSVITDDEFATDDRVVCRWRIRGTHTGELFGFPATGKSIEFAGVSMWEFDEGKARRGWTFPDLASVMAQLQT
jgi:steroid delta-isomerase-like uncharacterized protein